MESMLTLLKRLSENNPSKLSEQLQLTLGFYEPLMLDKYDYAPQRKRDLEQLLILADRFETRAQMLVDFTLDPPSSTADLPNIELGSNDPKKPKTKKSEEPPLVLSTIHSAKGLEWLSFM